MTKEIIADLANEFMDHLQTKIHTAKGSNIRDNLGATLDDEGFSEGAKQKATELFFSAVANKDSALRDGLAQLLGIYSPMLEGSDVIDAIADRIQQLEADIAYVERENENLKLSRKEKLSEDFLRQATQAERTPKKSYVADDLEAINEDATFAQGEKYIDPRMRQYMRYFSNE
jgi:hypothetical protein